MTHRRFTLIPKRLAQCSAAGFTLAEMAVVVLLMGLAMSMGLKMLTANLDNTAYSETKSKQERIKIALIGFLRTNGRLPCPNSVAPWDGEEDKPDVTPGSGPDPATTCLVNYGRGVVPWHILNLSRDTAQDGWGNFFTYRVANNTPGGAAGSNWTIKGGTNAFGIGELTSPKTTLTITELDEAMVPGTPNTGVIAVIISHGKNGFGARTVNGTPNTSPPSGTDEATNANNGSSFIRRAVTEVPVPTHGAYDDIVAYMTPQDFFQPLIDEKTMKVCKSYCSGTCPTTTTPTCTASNVPIGNPAPTCLCMSGETLP